ncbi:uncharacterized protein LOC124142887 [Haliotis rufescens]|uniref:uncharacterized protein LOC124142887 n=1 Tax=Haliotis rufescens TaxID=6454 RepID=UPI001EAFE935|nr:uncharacterized protein LOC124142887 [Haliotis rufescens]XP_046367535.1 uncharacterized protein LOC124142887 [Haliotis rufescens]
MPSDMIDIEEKVKIWGWETFMKTRSKDHAKLKYEDVQVEVNWNRVRFVSSTPEFTDRVSLEKPNSQIVFRSKYENWTAHEQEHSFHTERTTVSCCTTEVSKGFTKGFHLEVKLGLPEEVASATAGFGREVNMETTEENTKEEAMTWSINSSIKVPPKHRTIAELVVKEQEFNASFKMQVKIKGRVLVVVTNLRENNCFVQSIEGDFADIMKRENERKGFVIEKRLVTFDLSGNCKFRFGVEQHVQLHEEELKEEES